MHEARPEANGVTYSADGSGGCYAEFDMTGTDDSASSQSCLLNGFIPANSIDFDGQSQTVAVRLRDGGTRGVLELNIDGAGWDAVCDDGFGQAEAQYFCSRLGYGGGTQYDTTHGDDSFAATSVYDEPSVDFSRSPEDSTTVIVIDTKAVSPPSTSVYGKSATT